MARYDTANVADRPKQRRPPPRLSWVADAAFRKRLRALIKGGKSSKVIAAEVAEVSAYACDSSMVRKLDSGKAAQSWLVGEICKRYNWPMPPLADADEADLGELGAALVEISRVDPSQHAKLRRAIRLARENSRSILEVSGGTPANDERDDH